jgi:hypothetical protein
MYRDTAMALDEHDRAVGAILIGEALIDECERAANRVRQPEATVAQERWRAMAELQDAYPEVWRHLDRARRVLASRGINTAAYDELRPHTPRAPTTPDDVQSIDTAAFDDAKRAIAELKLVVPGTDWDAIEARTAGLVRAPLVRRRRQRFAIAGVVATFALAVLAWLSAIVPSHKVDRGVAMRQELADIQQQRKVRIESLTMELGNRCDPARAHELVKLLVLDGRGTEATTFGDGYLERCGEDSVVEHWANAPRPGH